MIKNLALEASAGSGKTYALSVRYLSLLFLGSKPEGILTLTFTNKAAFEMKRRIFDTLKNLESRSELEYICEMTKKSKDEILLLKPKILNDFLKSDLLISTIDSFFSSILRKFSFNIGLMPSFALEDSIINDDKIKRFLKICKKDMLYKSLVLFALNENKKLSDIFSLFAKLFERHSEINMQAFAKNNPLPYPNEKEILDILEEIKTKFLKNGLGKSALKTLQASSIKEVLAKKFLARVDFSYWSYKKFTDESINALHAELKEKLYVYIRAKEAYILKELALLYEAFQSALAIEAKQKSSLSFSEMTNRLYDILEDEITKDFLYFRIDGNFTHLLIDEFQDTNIVQYKILEPFMKELCSGDGVKQGRSLFLVGDTKQSIYRFRGGAKELFSYATEEFYLDIGVLDTNYRSSSSIVNFMNKTFGDKIQGYIKQKVKKECVQGLVEVCISEDISKELILNIQLLLENGVEQNDIAVLCYTNKEALLIKELIEDEIKKAKVTLEAKRKLIDIPIISAVIDFVKYLYFSDELYLQNFQTICGKNYNDEEHFFDLQKDVDKILIEIIRYFDIFVLEDDLLAFIQSCKKYKDIEDFLFNISDLTQSSISKEDEGIRVLTIHKSKGLEFSSVLVIDRLKRARSGGDTFIFEYEDIQLQRIFLKTKGREFFDKEYEKAKEKESVKVYEDSVNTQYVAFTRVKDNLIILAKEKNSAFENLELSNMQEGSLHVRLEDKKSKPKQDKCFMPKRLGLQDVKKKETDKTKTSDFKAIDFGLALHYMLEIIGRFDPDFVQTAYESMCNRFKIILDVEDLEDIRSRVERLIQNTKFIQITKNSKLFKEQPIYFRGERKQLDLLIEKEDNIIIVDYKSSEFLQPSHVRQVNKYKEAIEAIFGKKCEAYLCYLKKESDEIIKI